MTPFTFRSRCLPGSVIFPACWSLSLLLPCLGMHAEEVQTVKDRGPHQQRVETIRTFQDELGNTLTETNGYVQLEVGLNFQNAEGNWEASRAEFVGENGWAVARKGQHQVALYHNPNVEGAVVVRTPEGKRLRSHVYGLAFYDTASGQSVLIASVKDAEAQQVADNEVVYSGAFQELAADLRYTYTKSGIEQDVILREQLPSPEQYGFAPETTRLEVWTEFVEAETPAKSAQLLNGEEAARGLAAPLIDETLSFGQLGIGQGRTFQLGQESDALSYVAKNWIETSDGGKFLVETVAVDSIEAGLRQLPPGNGGARLHKPHSGRLYAGYRAPAKPHAKEVLGAGIRRFDHSRDTAAFSAFKRPGLVLDYVTSNGSLTNQVFKHSETYYIAGTVTLTGTNSVFEGGTVLKFANTNTPKVVVNTPVTWKASPYRMVILTSRDDQTVGQVVGTNTLSGYYADTALQLEAATAATSFDLSHLRIAHAKKAIVLNQRSGHVFSHLQLLNCQNGINPTSAQFSLRNALFYNVLTNFNGSSSTNRVEHLTVDGANWFNGNSTFTTANLTVTNSLLVAVTNYGNYTGVSVSTASSPTGVFQTVGGGGHYLVSGSAYRNAGNANVNASLLTDLKQMTTYAPAWLTNDVTVSTTLTPQVQRDTDTLDLGYHYCALDFLTTVLAVTNATLTVNNGVALGHSGSASLWLKTGASLKSQGLPQRLNVFARYPFVQESPISGATAHGSGWLTLNSANATSPEPVIDCRFTAFYADQSDFHVYSDGTGSGTFRVRSYNLKDCQFYGGKCQFSNGSTNNQAVALNNNLWIQTSLLASGPVILTAYNQHWWNGYFEFLDGTSGSIVRNSVFDNTSVVVEEVTVTNSHNGYVPTAATKLPGTAGSDVTAASLTYAATTGGLGNWYQSSTNFLNGGNQTAAAAGLYHYTVQTSRAKDTGNVDLGFHYVATDSSGVPLDYDSDGTPDYLEDLNGNGSVNSGETDWQSATDLGLRVLITRPQNNSVIP